MILKMTKRKIKVGLDLTKENKKSETFIIQGEVNPDMDKIKESSKNIRLDLTINQSNVIEYPRYLDN
jgi:hypothetical protein